MGFLESGAPLSWRESLRFLDEVKRRGVREFIELYHQYKDDVNDQQNIFWGDEVEFCLVQLDETTRTTRIFLGADEVLDELRTREALLAEVFHKDSKNRPPTSPPASPPSSAWGLTPGYVGEGSSAGVEEDTAAAEEEKQGLGNATRSCATVSVERNGGRGKDQKQTDCPFAWKLSGWHPEYGSHMIEAIPGKPYPFDLNSLFYLLPSMQMRRKKVQAALPPHCFAASLGSFPTMGVRTPGVEPRRRVYHKHWLEGDKSANITDDPIADQKGLHEEEAYYPGDFAFPPAVPDPVNSCSRSLFIGDEMINKHPRFSTLTANIRERRGEKVQILLPLLQDENTLKVLTDDEHEGKAGPGEIGETSSPKTDSPDVETERSLAAIRRQRMLEGKSLHDGQWIYMDCMGFGMGMHCVQATFGCRTLSDARYLHDQLAVLAPLWLALTAATPFARGLVAATDTRWDTIAASVDCRTREERGYLPKSRYESISLYISDRPALKDRVELYNDVPAPVEPRAFTALVKNGVDEILAKHIGFLFVRDPMVIFRDRLLSDLQGGISEQEAIRRIEADGQRDWAEDDGRRYLTTEDFENLQSTNWNSVRFKPPPSLKSRETSQSEQSCERVQDALERQDRRERGRVAGKVDNDDEGSAGPHEPHRLCPEVSSGEAGQNISRVRTETGELNSKVYVEQPDNSEEEEQGGVRGGSLSRSQATADCEERVSYGNASMPDRTEADHKEKITQPSKSCPGGEVGWRVEFRTPEAQLTDFENAACVALITLVAQVILEENLDMYIPMSLNDENMRRAPKLNSISNEKFWFRNDISQNATNRSYREMSVHEIFFGPLRAQQQSDRTTPPEIPSPSPSPEGLVHRCLKFIEKELECGRCSEDTAAQLLEYLDFIRYRTLGVLGTDAVFLRACLLAHPSYKRDSTIPRSAAFDLVDHSVKIGQGDLQPRSIFGPFSSRIRMRIDEGGTFANGVPVISSDFPCPSNSLLSSVRDKVVSERAKQGLENPRITSKEQKGEKVNTLSSVCNTSCLAGQAGEDSVASDTSLRIEELRRFLLGSKVPSAVALEWRSGKFQEYFRNMDSSGKDCTGMDSQTARCPDGRCSFGRSDRVILPGIEPQDSTWVWASLATRDRSFSLKDSNGEGRSEGNESTCCPSVGWGDDSTEMPHAAGTNALRHLALTSL